MKPESALDNSQRYPTSAVPSTHRIMVKHLHEGNDDGAKRASLSFSRHGRPPKYVTLAIIKDPTGKTVAKGKAVCSNRDTPNRRLGHEIAVARAIKEFITK